MLQSIRDRAQGVGAWIIVILISIPFALWGIHEYVQPTNEEMVAKVNDVKITRNEFERNVRQQQAYFRNMLQGQNIDISFFEKQIRRSTLENMIEQEVLIQIAEEHGLRIADQSLAASIHKIPAFQENGQFSPEQYQRLMKMQGMSPLYFENQMRRDLLTTQIRQGIQRSTLVPDNLKKQFEKLNQQQRLLSYLIIPKNEFREKITLTDEEIGQYYDENLRFYQTPEQVSVEYVELALSDIQKDLKFDEQTLRDYYQERITSYTTPVKWQASHILISVAQEASAEEWRAAKKRAEELFNQLKNEQADFASLAKEHSDDTESAKEGGDLGEFGRGRMVKPFEKALDTMAVGDISEPVRTQFGFHIIKLDDKQGDTVRPFEEVKEELANNLKQEQAENEFYVQYEQFGTLTFEHPHSLEMVAEVLDLQIKETDFFGKQGIAGDEIFSKREVIDAAFNDEVLIDGYNSSVIELEDQHVLALRVKTHKPPEQKPLAEVREDIEQTLTQQKLEEAAQQLGEQLLTTLKNGQSPVQVAAAHQLAWSEPEWVKRDDSVAGGGTRLVTEAFKLGHPSEAQQALYQGIDLNNGDYALLAVLAVKTDDAEENPNAQQQLTLAQSEFGNFLAALKSQMEIKVQDEDLK